MEVVPVVEVRPVVGVAIAAIVIGAIAAAVEHRGGAEPTAMKAATVEATASTVKTAAVKPAAAMTTTAMTAAATVTAANLDHRSVRCGFRCRRGAGTNERERFGALL